MLQQPFPNLGETLVGLGCVVLGLALFIHGLENGLFPLGEAIAQAFTKKSSLIALLSFAFCLGFGTTVAEPALIAIAAEAAEVVALAGHIENEASVRNAYALNLRIVVAFSVGSAVVIGVFSNTERMATTCHDHFGLRHRDRAHVLRVGPEIIGIAYDSGGVTTSTITVPLLTALGVGLATSIKGRNPMLDGFGLIAFACLAPIIFILAYNMVA